MAWRLTKYLIEGELSNKRRGKVAGWMRFAGLPDTVRFELEGDFHRDIQGTIITFSGEGKADDPEAKKYMGSFSLWQKGKVGDITAGHPPHDYVDYPYIEWYSEANGRVVLELEPHDINVIGTPLPFELAKPVSRRQQGENFAEHLRRIVESL